MRRPVLRDEDTADMRCTGVSCPAQLERHIINFVGRGAMDIKGFGEVYAKGTGGSRLYFQHRRYFSAENHRGTHRKGNHRKEKNTDKLLNAIEEAKRTRLIS